MALDVTEPIKQPARNSSGLLVLRYPITGVAGCRARDITGCAGCTAKSRNKAAAASSFDLPDVPLLLRRRSP
jgi:hypothetical protein